MSAIRGLRTYLSVMVVRDDGELLQAWTDGRSAGAFEEIVRRYIDMVYATAVRSLGGDRQLADDVTQAVFLILSKKAHSIHTGAALASWLHQTTRFAAANARKMQSRRRHHEHVAATQRTEVEMMMPQISTTTSSELDDAIASLTPADRAAIVARYLKGQDLITIAGDLGISTDAVQKRLERSIHKLRDYFIRHRVKANASGVVASLTSVRAVVAPPAVAKSMIDNILAGSHSGTVTSLASGTLKSMNIATAKTVTAYVAGTIAVAAVIGFICVSIMNIKPKSPAKPIQQANFERLAQK